ncbi:glycosyltransferase family 39 protein [Candidatus Daviesbacteria bacterium]|nr:glycosyltransferase family 39 protein [Candidatus Daviesbacteria bacterium]
MKKTTILLLGLLLIAFVLRFYKIDQIPKSMYGDGMTAVYDAWSIFKTAHDQKGNFLPLVFELGGGRPAGYIYATVPFAALFGPTALASQMVSVLSGIGIVLLLFLIGRQLFSEKIGLSIAAVSALNPWELSMSRGPYESHFALFLTLLGVYAFIKGFRHKYWFLLWGLTFGLASQTYGSYRLTIPLFTILLLIWILCHSERLAKNLTIRSFTAFRMTTKDIILFLSLGVVILSTILSAYLTISKGQGDRFDILNIFKNPAVRSQISQKVKADRLVDTSSPAFSYTFHNPPLELAGLLAENYFSNFFPEFLFIKGDGEPRHNPAEIGGMFWIDFVLIILGIVFLYKKDKRLLLLLAGWALIAPIPTSLVGSAHALRSSLLLPPLIILAGLGLYKLLTTRKSNKISAAALTILALLFIFQFGIFLDKFYFVAPRKNTKSWSYPAKKASAFALQNKDKFDYVFLSNDIDNMEFAYPVYAKLDPGQVINQNRTPAKLDEYKFFKYDNVYIGSIPHTRLIKFIKDLEGSVLYVGSAKEQPYLENYQLVRGFDESLELVAMPKDQIPNLDYKDF